MKTIEHDATLRPISVLRVNSDRTKEIYTGYVSADGSAQQMKKSNIAVLEPEWHIIPCFLKSKATISIEVTEHYVWEFDGKQFEHLNRIKDFFRGRSYSLYEKDCEGKSASKWKQIEWNSVCTQACRYLNYLAEAGVETSFKDKLYDCGVGIVKILQSQTLNVKELPSDLSKIDFYHYLRDMTSEPRILTQEILDWCLFRATPNEKKRYGNYEGSKFNKLEQLVLEGAWDELLRLHLDCSISQDCNVEVCEPER